MSVDVGVLLGLPAAERLELADILRRSVGCPVDIESLNLPAWQRAHFDRLLRQCTERRDDHAPDQSPHEQVAPRTSGPTDK